MGGKDVEAGKALLGPLQIVGIVFGARFQAGLAGHEIRIHALAALHGDRAIAGAPAGLDGDRGVKRVGVMVGDQCAVRHPRLGMALLAPAFHRETPGAANGAGPGQFAGRKAGLFGRIDGVARIGGRWRGIDDVRARKQERRTGIDRDGDTRRFDDRRIGVQAARLVSVDGDADGAAIAALPVERGQDCAVVAARPRDQPACGLAPNARK